MEEQSYSSNDQTWDEAFVDQSGAGKPVDLESRARKYCGYKPEEEPSVDQSGAKSTAEFISHAWKYCGYNPNEELFVSQGPSVNQGRPADQGHFYHQGNFHDRGNFLDRGHPVNQRRSPEEENFYTQGYPPEPAPFHSQESPSKPVTFQWELTPATPPAAPSPPNQEYFREPRHFGSQEYSQAQQNADNAESFNNPGYLPGHHSGNLQLPRNRRPHRHGRQGRKRHF